MNNNTDLKQITVRSMRGGNLSLGLFDFRVDRGSPLGNPYEMEKDESNRDRVCEAYRHWLFANVRMWTDMKKRNMPRSWWNCINPLNLPVVTKNPFDTTGLRLAPSWTQADVAQVENEFTKLCYTVSEHDISLICWCFPKACHADVLRSAIIWYHKAYLEECRQVEVTINEFFGESICL